MKRAIAVTVSVLSLSSLSLVGSASAAPVRVKGCPWFCLYTNENYRGEGVTFPISGRHGCLNISPHFRRNASSMKNSEKFKVWLYAGMNCTGKAGYVAKPHSSDKSFRNNKFNDKASSLSW
ncbi:peptidase inhibitor family I36 protein [Actinoallomurus acanthiterrae]